MKCKCGRPLSFWENEYEFDCLDCRIELDEWLRAIQIASVSGGVRFMKLWYESLKSGGKQKEAVAS